MSHFGGNLLPVAVSAPAVAICLNSLILRKYVYCFELHTREENCIFTGRVHVLRQLILRKYVYCLELHTREENCIFTGCVHVLRQLILRKYVYCLELHTREENCIFTKSARAMAVNIEEVRLLL